MSEKTFQNDITDLCDTLGLLWYHVPDSRRTNAGFPDLVITGPRGTIFAELKTKKGYVTAAQKKWHLALERSGQVVYVWRPEHMQYIVRRLTELSGRRLAGRVTVGGGRSA